MTKTFAYGSEELNPYEYFVLIDNNQVVGDLQRKDFKSILNMSYRQIKVQMNFLMRIDIRPNKS